jgi:hypothetical protein
MRSQEILIECKKLAKISACDYADIKSYRVDCRERNRWYDKAVELLALFPHDYEYLIDSSRLKVGPYSLDYTVGQYTPTEIYFWLVHSLQDIIREKIK